GTNKALMIEAAVAGPALALAAKAGALPGMTGAVAPTALKVAAPLVVPTAPAPVPSGLDPRYNPGYASTPISQQYNPQADAGFGPNVDPLPGQPLQTAQAGMFGDLFSSPLVMGALIGVPLLWQFFTSRK